MKKENNISIILKNIYKVHYVYRSEPPVNKEVQNRLKLAENLILLEIQNFDPFNF